MPTYTTNPFGDVRAEHDHAMLDSAFHEWQDYKSLFDGSDRFIVVGRRGSGKSALTYRLSRDWAKKRQPTIVIAPTEEQVLGLRPLAERFGNSVSRIRAGIKLACQYALLMEIGLHLQGHYKAQNDVSANNKLSSKLARWAQAGSSPVERLRETLRETGTDISDPQERIADLPKLLDLSRLSEQIQSLVSSHNLQFLLLIDRLDEGYEPDTVGIGIVDGIIYGVDQVRVSLGQDFKAVVFLRDNIFRAIQAADNDFSRNLESQVLRLHWDQQELFYMVTKRIRAALKKDADTGERVPESDVKAWNSITAGTLHGREGFKRCLKLTLYRPRDIIALLNTAYYQAQRQQRETLIEQDIQHSSKQISITRFDDLGKEYQHVLPGIRELTSVFAQGIAKMSVAQANERVMRVFNDTNLDEAAARHLRILATPEEALKALYGVGFMGIFDKEHGSFVFSHDGKKPHKALNKDDSVMIHPCYWSALSLEQQEIEQSSAEEIFDEYEITISSYTTTQRSQLLGQQISALGSIPMGSDGDAAFEEWCKRAVEIAFAKQLANVQLKPNAAAPQRRDIVATNSGLSGFWKRILGDYGTRLVVFEVKNYQKIGIDEYRQVHSYLGREYGKCGFILCRDEQSGLVKGAELDAFKEFYNKEFVIVKLTAGILVNILSKLRSPEKIDVPNQMLERSLDTHITLYANGQTDRRGRRR